MRKTGLVIALILLVAVIYVGYNVFGPVVSAPEGKYLFIPTGSNYSTVKNRLSEQKILNNTFFFNLLARQTGYDDKVKPGRYEIKQGSNLLSLIRMLKAGRQSPVKLVITKLRTKEDLAEKIAGQFEVKEQEVLSFLLDNDSLKKYNLDTNTAMTAIIPNTYLLYWNSPFPKLFKRLYDESGKFWTKEREQKAAAKNLTPEQVYIIASIVDEETNMQAEKGNVASVYINRVRKGMKLQADPTVKYALRNFGLKRIFHGHLAFPSAYNTYYSTGLPPGPICTAQPKTIDAVLDAPETNYIFFAAKSDFKGSHVFSSTFEEHKRNANAYRFALDSLTRSRQNNVQN